MLFQIRGMIDRRCSFLKFSCRNLISMISTPEALRNCSLKRSKDRPKMPRTPQAANLLTFLKDTPIKGDNDM